MTAADFGDEDFYGDLRPILDGDMAAFVREDDRHRSLTVVREEGDVDVIGETRRWLDRVRADAGDVDGCTAMRRAVERHADGSRDGQLRGALAVVRLDERGHRGLAAALDQLWQVRAKDGRDFRRLVEFARGRVITSPSRPEEIGCRCGLPPTGDVMDIVADDVRERLEQASSKSSEPPSGGAQSAAAPRSPLRLPILPAEFWTARPRLAHIRQAAHARLVAADLVLHVIFARLAAMRSHELWFDTGRRGSLNYFAAPIGPTGVGKTTGVAAVDGELLPVPHYLKTPKDGTFAAPYYDGLPSGSGEGIAEAYIGEIEIEVDGGTKKVRGQVRHNVFLYVDEGEQLLRIGERTGATALTTIRSAWPGETIGQHNGRAETTRVVQRGTYSLGMVVGFQPARALPLLSETAGGTAQRFAWLSAIDPTIPDEPVEHPGPLPDVLTDTLFANSARSGRMSFPADVVAELRRDHIAKVRGELLVDEADSHEPLMRAKMAALLALLDGRGDVDTEDWQLAGVMWETSRAVRDAVAEHGQQEAQREQSVRDDARVTLAERTAAVVDVAPVRVQRIAHRIAEKVHDAGGLLRAAARRGVKYDERHLYDAAATVAETRGWITVDASGALLPGPEKPS